VVFAGLTVVVSLCGMLLMGVPVVRSLALGAAVTVLIAVTASLTLVPALLGFMGASIDRLRVPGRRVDEAGHRATTWFRWSRLVQRRPWPFAVVGLAVLLALAAPALSLRLGSGDAGSDPTTKTARRAYDLLAAGFGPGFNGPLLVVAEVPRGNAADVQGLTDALRGVDGVAAVAPPQFNPAGDVAVVTVFPTTAPQDEATLELMNRLRDDVIPSVTAATPMRVSVGGDTANYEDLGVTHTERLPIFIAVVLGLSFLLLTIVFRSVVIPLKAVVMNVLSIGAAYGVIVAVFQWGWAAGVIGIDRTGPIQSFIPMLLFAVLFGLSMDYEVFLISRIREEYLRVNDSGLAVADGLAATARVITAAAAIMVAVFGSAVLAEDRTTKLFGLGLATAIFIDATVVRTVLVPATMELLGRANWWLPKWLDRLLPRISVDAEGPAARAVLAEEVTVAVDSDTPALVDRG
jgi:RND superfamily putative drug exporter